MARLWTCGFELNSGTAGVEVDTVTSPAAISSLQSRSGTYSLRLHAAANAPNIAIKTNSSLDTTHTSYLRLYLLVAALPGGTVAVCNAGSNGSTPGSNNCSIALTSTGTLQLRDSSGTQIGSDSPALTLNTWYRVELSYTKATPTCAARLNGSQFASGTPGAGTSGFNNVTLGPSGGTPTFDIYIDDVALNDSTGSLENGYPEDAKLVYLSPNASGDSTQWTPDTGSNFARVNEVTPDDATSLVKSKTLNNSDFYTIGTSPIGSTDTVNVVHVGARFNNDVADATTALQLQIEKVSGGTVTRSSAIVPNTTTWSTNAVAAPRLYPLTLYQDPDNINWTNSTINSMQIGQLLSTGGTNNIQVTKVWAIVDYTPSRISFNNYQFIKVGNGMSVSEKIR